MISDELIRVAILWHELWHEGLEEASRLYFGENNVKGMFATLEPLHAMMERGPQTLKETSFNQVRGRINSQILFWALLGSITQSIYIININIYSVLFADSGLWTRFNGSAGLV